MTRVKLINYFKMIIQRILTLPLSMLKVIDNRRGREKQETNISIKRIESSHLSEVDAYWSEHTVHSEPFKTPEDSLKYLEWRFQQYPLFRDFMELYGNHDNEIVIDYGCGPGNDLVGFLVYSKAKKVIGIDVSEKALNLAGLRIELHQVDPSRVELILTSDSNSKIPIADNTVDYIYCEGVLHHTSDPGAILEEFHRTLKQGSHACIMVYNHDSVWLHLYTAYERMIRQNAFPGMDIYEAFSSSTDGVECPIARCYAPDDFMNLCNSMGFDTEYIGGYLSLHELGLLKELGDEAVLDERLADEHKDFLRNLVYDEQGYPKYKGKHAGIGGVYRLCKA